MFYQVKEQGHLGGAGVLLGAGHTEGQVWCGGHTSGDLHVHVCCGRRVKGAGVLGGHLGRVIKFSYTCRTNSNVPSNMTIH